MVTAAPMTATSAAVVDDLAEAVPAPRPVIADGKVAWAVVPLDHTEALTVAAMPDGGAVVMGQNEWLVTTPKDMFVTRLAPDGTTTWQDLGLGRFVRCIGATKDAVFLLTEYAGAVSFGGAKDHAVGRSDLFLAKLGLDGALAWGHSFGTSDYDRSGDIVPQSDGGVVLLHGAFTAPKGVSPAFPPGGGEHALLSHWSAAGERTWTTSFGWTGYDEPEAAIAGADGNTYVAGTRWLSASNDLGARTGGGGVGWVALVKPDGTVVWSRNYGEETAQTKIERMTPSVDGRALVAGTFRGTKSFGGATFDAPAGGFVAQIDRDGGVAWARVIPEAQCLLSTSFGGVIVVTTNQVLSVTSAGAPRVLNDFSGQKELTLRRCALAGDHRLYVTGAAPPGTKLGDIALPKPRTMHTPPWLTDYQDGFVAGIDI